MSRRLSLTGTAEFAEQIKRDAKSRGQTLNEWLRRAAVARLEEGLEQR